MEEDVVIHMTSAPVNQQFKGGKLVVKLVVKKRKKRNLEEHNQLKITLQQIPLNSTRKEK